MTLRLMCKWATGVPLEDPETYCKMTFRGVSKVTDTFDQRRNRNKPLWNKKFEWDLKSAPATAEEVIEVEIVYETSAERDTATAFIRLDSILGKEDESDGRDLDVDSWRGDGELADMKLLVNLAYTATQLEQENRQLKLDKEQLEHDKKRVEQENERLEQENEQLKERLEQDKERLEQENKQLEQDKVQLEQDKERIE